LITFLIKKKRNESTGSGKNILLLLLMGLFLLTEMRLFNENLEIKNPQSKRHLNGNRKILIKDSSRSRTMLFKMM
jgi:hypothetical protein